ncbi:MAG: hypothetical protein MUF62_13980 [Chitinophagaceae bacterium]|nr:hypothetical protein [Chitinophagaceae bacterium]
MKNAVLFIVGLSFLTQSLQAQQYDIFTYSLPAGFVQLQKDQKMLALEKKEGKNYCQLVIGAAVHAAGDAAADFESNWNFFARNPQQGVTNPETRDTGSLNNWHMLFGAARGKYNGQTFALSLSSFSKANINYFVGAVFTDEKYIPVVQAFIAGVWADEAKFAAKQPQPAAGANNASVTSAIGAARQPLSSTLFNDGWKSTAHDDYVSIEKNGAEVRLIFPDAALDKNRPSNTSVFEPHYWDNVVRKYYQINGQVINREKPPYSLNEYDIWIAPATDLASGKAGYVAMMLSPNSSGTVVMTVFSAETGCLAIISSMQLPVIW